MELNTLTAALKETLGAELLAILAAVALLLVGYVLALLARVAVRKVLSIARANALVSDAVGKSVDIERGAGLGAFWFVLLVTVIGVFDVLELEQAAKPFADMMAQIMTYLPNLLAGAVLVALAWLVAAIIRAAATRALKATQWDEKLNEQTGVRALGDNVGQVLFWLVILMFLPAVLGVFRLQGMLDPVRSMVNEILAVLPNIFAAGVVLFAGWIVAKILQGLVTNLLAAAGADKLGESAGLKDAVELSRLGGLLVFILVFVPALIAALDALQIAAISGPATHMLNEVLGAIPNIFAAVLILSITWYVARFAAGLLGRLLDNVGADALPAKMGLGEVFVDGLAPSVLAPRVVVFFAMLSATVEAAHRLDFTAVEELVTLFIGFGGNVLLGLSILVIGFWLANLAYQAVLRGGGEQAGGVARIARYAILALVLAMGLSAMGIAEEIVNLAFGLLLGAVAVAIALSFGLGGREAAGRQMEHWLARLRGEKPE